VAPFLESMRAERRRGFLLGLVAGAAVAVAVGAIADALFGPFGSSGTVSDARTTIEDNYFHRVGSGELDNASIEGMIDALRHRYHDRFSHYLDPKSVGQFESETSGQFSGIGLTVIGVKGGGLRVASVFPGTPARKAGLERGDQIVAADGKSLRGRSKDAAVALIRGTPGTTVSLRVVPAGGGNASTLRVKRAEVRVPAVKGMIRRADGDKVAYVRFATFSEGAHGELREAVDRLYQGGAQGLVLDLRGNGGGLLDEAVLSASVFLHKGERVVSTRSRTQGDTNYDAVGDPVRPKPIVVLVDHDTASAAEILTAALAEHHLATVVGTRTFGKGTFQQALDLPNGGALDLTIGRFFTANGSSTLNDGIVPNVHAADNPRTKNDDEALRRALAILGGKLGGGR
jgi:carboxyl-terminal processing protease